MLSISELSIGKSRRPIIKNLSLSIKQGEAIAIMGPSGCGKTTLLRAIGGLVEKLDNGQICNNGIVWQTQKKNYYLPGERSATLLMQELAVWPHLSVRQQLDLVKPKTACTHEPGPSTSDLIDALNLQHRQNALARDLSGGEKQRLALGRVLRTNSQILLLDEPFTSLDQTTKLLTIQLVKRLACALNISLIVATHNPSEAQMLSARTLHLN